MSAAAPQATAPLASARFDTDEAAAVLVRAAELQSAHCGSLAVTDLEKMAEEMGVDAAFVRQALAEQQANAAAAKAQTSASAAAVTPMQMLFPPEPPLVRWQKLILVTAPILFFTVLFLMARSTVEFGPAVVLYYPAFLALLLGALMPGPRTGAKLGTVLLTGTMAGAIAGSPMSGLGAEELAMLAGLCTGLIGGGAAAGAVGGRFSSWLSQPRKPRRRP